MRNVRPRPLTWFAAALVVAPACSSASDSSNASGNAGGDAGANASVGGSAGEGSGSGAPIGGSSGGGNSAGGESSDSGGSLDANAPSQEAGAGAGASAVDAGAYPSFVDGGPCPANAFLCDDFEEYALTKTADGLDLTEMLPNWQQFSFHGYPRVDGTKPYTGAQSAHYDTESGSYRFAAFVRETPDGVAALPLAHFGRVMVYLNAISPASQWTMIEAQGLLPGSTTEVATYGFGGNNGFLAASYSQRPRDVTADGGIELRAGGPLNAGEEAKSKLDCTQTATTETFPTERWACVEWNIDAAQGIMHLWLDGVAQTEIDVAGHGNACAIGSPSAAWEAPSVFTKVDLTWEGYGSDSPGHQSFFDDFAVGEERIGCPTPPADGGK